MGTTTAPASRVAKSDMGPFRTVFREDCDPVSFSDARGLKRLGQGVNRLSEFCCGEVDPSTFETTAQHRTTAVLVLVVKKNVVQGRNLKICSHRPSLEYTAAGVLFHR